MVILPIDSGAGPGELQVPDGAHTIAEASPIQDEGRKQGEDARRRRGAMGRTGENKPAIGNDGQKHRGRRSVLMDMKSR